MRDDYKLGTRQAEFEVPLKLLNEDVDRAAHMGLEL